MTKYFMLNYIDVVEGYCMSQVITSCEYVFCGSILIDFLNSKSMVVCDCLDNKLWNVFI